MKCNECHWCSPNSSTGSDVVCCNKSSENYNKIFTEEASREMECEDAETEKFVSRYYA